MKCNSEQFMGRAVNINAESLQPTTCQPIPKCPKKKLKTFEQQGRNRDNNKLLLCHNKFPR
jgi:hypothetical protein